MHILDEKELQEKALPAWRRVFTAENNNIYSSPFTPEVESRAIVYPAHDDLEDFISVETLVNAAAKVGDQGIYIFAPWDGNFVGGSKCYVPLAEFIDGYTYGGNKEKSIYYQLGANVHNKCVSFLSSNGAWGIMMDLDHVGIIGGSLEFMAEIRKGTPNLDQQVYQFLAELEYLVADGYKRAINEWLPELLTHVYGKKKAKIMTEITGCEYTI
ncbi:hypothetical protein Pse7367_0115 [Thalassoporum mexicanum PCC 7367]|uniref:hypothetical protein n=1 Tax=Thalassoporum mexicanum TaxID=3457544 RepID=UPI00029FCC38|nr:hypothetical protein [Pseudanabaena sp. PCC 7367]AFY68433.1 hypothetical protein Pse7367_0115 [Pseudanabaena sp. PCC 7367]